MDAILLAAGNSVRFGNNKLLYLLNGKLMYQYILELLYCQKKENRLEHVIVVSQYAEILEDVEKHFPELGSVCNPKPELGISGSIRLGLEYLEKVSVDSDACLFTVADQPCLTMESLIKIEQFWKESACGIAAAAHGDRIGNPVIFSKKYYEELKSLEGDVGGKKVLRRHMDDTGVCEIPVHELEDMDTLESVRAFEWKRERQ